MHELSIALGIVEAAEFGSGGACVHRVIVEVGEQAAVSGDALLFCFEAACSGTCVEGATLELRAVAESSVLRVVLLEVDEMTGLAS